MLKLSTILAGFILLILPTAAMAQKDSLPDAIINPGPVAGHILVVDKSEQLLYLYNHDGQGGVSLEKVMSCSTGKRQGDKMVEGDKKTPEGFYIFNEKKLPREMSPIFGILAYPTDYPNFWDRHLGRGGYGIWMHGINKPLKDYDSNGCVELVDVDIAPMESIIHLYDTPIIIYETVTTAPVEQIRAEGQKVLSFMESWGRAWVGKDYAAYQNHYAPDFVNSDGQSFKEWMERKKVIGQKTEKINLAAKDLKVFRHRDVIVAIFQQDYSVDDDFASSGLKRLYLKPEGQTYKIVAEEYQPLPDKTTTKWLTEGQKKKVLGDGAEKKNEISPEVKPEEKSGLEEKTEGQLKDDSVSFVEPENSEQLSSVNVIIRPDDKGDKKNLEPSEIQTLSRAEEEALVREEARLNQELTRTRVKASEAQTGHTLKKERAKRRSSVNTELDAETKALAAAKAKLYGEPMTKEELKEHLFSLARAWGEAWSNHDVDAYFNFYHPDFYYQDKKYDLQAFIDYRKPLIENNNEIENTLSYFSIKHQGDLARVMFRQNYRSGQLNELGRRILVFKESSSGWKIISETWQIF